MAKSIQPNTPGRNEENAVSTLSAGIRITAPTLIKNSDDQFTRPGSVRMTRLKTSSRFIWNNISNSATTTTMNSARNNERTTLCGSNVYDDKSVIITTSRKSSTRTS